MRKYRKWVGLLLACAVSASQAHQCKGVDFPDHARVHGTDLTLNGLGLRKATFLKINVYVAALYVARPSHDPQVFIESAGPEELILHFVRDVGVDDLTKAWSEGFAKAGEGAPAALQARIATLNSWMSDVKTGQRLTFTRLPGEGLQVEFNGNVKGTIAGDDFARAFFSIWLGALPPNPQLKSGLLGGACE